jgi:hypothetical protein
VGELICYRSSTMDLDHEPELADILDEGDVPLWLMGAIDAALAATPEEAALWSEVLALAFGRRANRIARDQTDFDGVDRR